MEGDKMDMKMKGKYFFGVFVLAIIFLVIVGGCEQKQENIIKIGAILPLTGPGSYLGEQARDGMLLAQEEINFNGGINGAKIKITFEDSKADAKEAINAFNRLIQLEHPNAVITAFTSPTLAIIPLAEENKIPLLTTITSGPDIAKKGKYIFRVFTNADMDAPVMAKTLVENGLINFGVLYINDDYGVSYYEAFKKTVENYNGKVVVAETFSRADTDFRTQLLKIKNAKPEAIYIVGYDNHYIISFRQTKELGLHQVLAGNWILASPNVLDKMQGNAEGVYTTTPTYYLDQLDNKNERFNTRYKERFNKTADAYSAFGYDSLMLISKAAAIKGAQPEQIRTGLLEVNYNGLMGNLNFDSNGEINFKLYPARIKEGELVLE
ncbi:hypothetical protein DRJ17_05870 [Candidatus Woesearchaeota archaeon]|nr:MAG: hypothetical protein DRJ17_05870 [Candidatus Woesearchaeota archaeon]